MKKKEFYRMMNSEIWSLENHNDVEETKKEQSSQNLDLNLTCDSCLCLDIYS